jgi:hypothetical protein
VMTLSDCAGTSIPVLSYLKINWQEIGPCFSGYVGIQKCEKDVLSYFKLKAQFYTSGSESCISKGPHGSGSATPTVSYERVPYTVHSRKQLIHILLQGCGSGSSIFSLQNMKIMYILFSFFVGHFCPPRSGSGSSNSY